MILNCFGQDEVRDWDGDGGALQEDIGPDMCGFFFSCFSLRESRKGVETVRGLMNIVLYQFGIAHATQHD